MGAQDFSIGLPCGRRGDSRQGVKNLCERAMPLPDCSLSSTDGTPRAHRHTGVVSKGQSQALQAEEEGMSLLRVQVTVSLAIRIVESKKKIKQDT